MTKDNEKEQKTVVAPWFPVIRLTDLCSLFVLTSAKLRRLLVSAASRLLPLPAARLLSWIGHCRAQDTRFP